VVSIEGRVPFLDRALVETALKIPCDYKLKNGKGKYILKNALASLLPEEIVNREKAGFLMPIDRWIKSLDLGRLVEEIPDYINRSEVERYVSLHTKGNRQFGYELWMLKMLSLWHHMER
jgi:asparagine synthase (glutamine-hydrolysing)